MTLGWTLLGTFGELVLAYLLFMGVVFSAAGVVGEGASAHRGLALLDLAMFVLPGLCVLAAAIVVVLQWRGAGVASYRWYALPLVGGVAYGVLLAGLRRAAKRRLK